MGYNIEKMRWSFSRLHAWEQCPYAFYLKYIERRDGESNYYASNGKCMHEVLEAVFTRKISIEDCTKYYADNYELICEKTKQETMDSTYEKCMDYLSVLENIDENKYEVVGVELELKFKIKEYNFVGFADLVIKNKSNGEIVLIDHKQATHFLKKDGTPLKNQLENFLAYKHQMYLYCKGLKDCIGVNVDKIVWNHFKEIDKTTIIPFIKSEYEETLDWAINTIEEIKNDVEFPSKESYVMCTSLCDYRNDCEYKQ